MADTMTTTLPDFTEEEAIAAVTTFKKTKDQFRAQLLELFDRKAHVVLTHADLEVKDGARWSAFCHKILGLPGTKSHHYQLLTWARIETAAGESLASTVIRPLRALSHEHIKPTMNVAHQVASEAGEKLTVRHVRTAIGLIKDANGKPIKVADIKRAINPSEGDFLENRLIFKRVKFMDCVPDNERGMMLVRFRLPNGMTGETAVPYCEIQRIVSDQVKELQGVTK